MKVLVELVRGFWNALWYSGLAVGSVTGLSWVFGVLGMVLLFGAVLVPFWLMYPLLVWWGKLKRT